MNPPTPKGHHVKYMRRANTTIATLYKGKKVVAYGFAIQNPEDVWVERIGKTIARGRAIKAYAEAFGAGYEFGWSDGPTPRF